ncbi:MAG TPA: CvpA family protein [Acetobacteraceae bacterium]|nr:CvpA family protein [Acetobacteraceae bacterium]
MDLVVLAVIVLSGLLALMRGLIREALGIGAWIVAAVVASPYGVFNYVAPWARQQFADTALADTLAFAGVFLVVLIVLSLVAGAISRAIQGSVLGGLDRTLGLVFGLVRGALVLCVAYILAGMAVAVDQWPPAVLDARSLPFIYRGSEWLVAHTPTPYRPSLSAPPPGRPTSAASLLHANPAGRALGARPSRE